MPSLCSTCCLATGSAFSPSTALVASPGSAASSRNDTTLRRNKEGTNVRSRVAAYLAIVYPFDRRTSAVKPDPPEPAVSLKSNLEALDRLPHRRDAVRAEHGRARLAA